VSATVRRITGWHILGGTAIVLVGVIVFAVGGSVAYVIAHGVGYVLTRAWWA